MLRFGILRWENDFRIVRTLEEILMMDDDRRMKN